MSNKKAYYKVLDKDMCSPYQDFQYKLDKTYSTDKPLELCECGFHACKNMYEMVIWTCGIPLKDCRFFECILGDTIIEGYHKVVSNSITLTKEISFEEVDKCIKDNLDTLVYDEDENIRRDVAYSRYGLDILINDKSPNVRAAVAGRGYGLDILINDVDWYVRVAVARVGYGLDILINDESLLVRETVAKQGYGLDILINDEEWYVRAAATRMLEKVGVGNE